MNYTAHNIIQLNKQTLCGCEVAFLCSQLVGVVGWCSGIVIATMAFIVEESDFFLAFFFRMNEQPFLN
jgi:hypothetical protein